MEFKKNIAAFLSLSILSLIIIMHPAASFPADNDDRINSKIQNQSSETSNPENVGITSEKDSDLHDIYTNVKDGKIYLYLFYAYDCPHCEDAYTALNELKKQYPELVVSQYELKKNASNREFFKKISDLYDIQPKGYPVIFIGKEATTGFFKTNTPGMIVKEIKRLKRTGKHEGESTEMDIPVLGRINVQTISLPLLTLYMGLLDGLNPCAMWVLIFLLGLLIHANKRHKVILIGSIFVASSGLVYFAFMTAWLNFFLIIGYSSLVTKILAGFVIFMGLVNVKDFFFFKKGISFSIPESAKPKLYKKVRAIIAEKNTAVAIAGTILLAIFVNFIELGCTIGFPALYTRILSLRGLETFTTYLYMGLFNVAYIIPLAIIVSLFAITMGRFKFTEKHGKILKIVSGIVMIALGVIMFVAPHIL